ncbi:hypothetical protein C8E03_11954 [Lachnotalea glycerini]|uniref:Uncharacterized protein n=1 Tax=Lachnotalea glycerini TaxID=1763509 RepID=A0A318EM86_9FIRM|nr:hypothetical protein C8E03_11954 [Lachnotalea glycerini]
MTYYTIVGKTVTCPHWNEKITLKGKYLLSSDTDIAKFLYATCPIVENSKLPLSKQINNFKLLRCPNKDNRCELLDQFKKVININTDGYSQ